MTSPGPRAPVTSARRALLASGPLPASVALRLREGYALPPPALWGQAQGYRRAGLEKVFCGRGGALYFHIRETEKECFIEEIPDETMVIGRNCMTSSGRSTSRPPGLGMFVPVKDPKGQGHPGPAVWL
ncbi:transmembrane emp24 domain-containing protein 9-like [Ailuropoda melanoleuca]|uniref:transmembrane emp24 domain-containing protein 9-like n=1 Tax=Ailuropoda melanoleuca TaxID=9646 RepID=UPI001494DD79|nr:transmembrane emp24 domain-containing protein 9-like [Ailuropoda melanoleuca]